MALGKCVFEKITQNRGPLNATLWVPFSAEVGIQPLGQQCNTEDGCDCASGVCDQGSLLCVAAGQ